MSELLDILGREVNIGDHVVVCGEKRQLRIAVFDSETNNSWFFRYTESQSFSPRRARISRSAHPLDSSGGCDCIAKI